MHWEWEENNNNIKSLKDKFYLKTNIYMSSIKIVMLNVVHEHEHKYM